MRHPEPLRCPWKPHEGFRVTMMHHPSHHVLDLDDTAEWFERVFGRSSTPIAEVLSHLTVRPDLTARLLEHVPKDLRPLKAL